MLENTATSVGALRWMFNEILANWCQVLLVQARFSLDLVLTVGEATTLFLSYIIANLAFEPKLTKLCFDLCFPRWGLLVLSYVWVTRVVVDRPLQIFHLAKVRYVVPLVILFIGMGQILVSRSWIRIMRARRGVDRLRIAWVMVLLFVIPVVILKVPRRIRKFLVTKSSA